ncbi:MAG: hypothetical protein EBX40_00605 [Gammaproteobacteria bacterium]|nr:hypothetical protein [Gammaproteobacteria bacterium]
MEIQLQKWVAWWNAYGKAHSDEVLRIEGLTNPKEKREATIQHTLDSSARTVAFFTNTELQVFADKFTAYDSMKLAAELTRTINTNGNELLRGELVNWQGTTWQLSAPYVSENQTAEDHEVITDMALLYADIAAGKAEALYKLCAAYLRAPEEPYNAALIADNSERVELMKTLPVYYAFQIKHFINASLESLEQSD